MSESAKKAIKLEKGHNQQPTADPNEYYTAVKQLSALHPHIIQKNDSQRDTLLESCGKRSSVTDAVISTMLSQNTTDANSKAAYAKLKSKFPRWEMVASCDDVTVIEDCIKVAGLASTRAERIRSLLRTVAAKRGAPCLARAKAELGRFKGIGPKTISCVLLFGLDRAEFPVDTHVLRISQQTNWVSHSATREAAYERLNAVVPDELKMDWHCLLVAHGKVCHDCAARGKPHFLPRDGGRIDCPLVRIRKGRCLDVLKERVDEKVALVASKSRGLEKTKAAVDKDIKLSVAMIKQERLKNDINGDSRGGLDVTYGGEDDKIKLSVAVPRKEKFKNRKSGHGRRMKTGNHKGKLMAKENILKQEEVALLNALTDDIIK